MTTRVTPEQEVIRRAREEIEKKTGKSPEELYEEREKRVTDAIHLKEPDRVPVVLGGGNFSLRNAGLPNSAAFYEPALCKQAIIRTALDFEPDLYRGSITSRSGLGLEVLASKQWRWPGGNLPPDSTLQFVEGEWMKADEYDLLITDPTDYVLHYFLPRTYGALAPFSKLPPLDHEFAGWQTILPVTANIFTSSEFQKAAETLLKAGQEQAKFDQVWEGFGEDIASIGFPPETYSGGVADPPLDWIFCFLRGMVGTWSDMFKQPEKLLAAAERLWERRVARATPADPKAKWYPRRVAGHCPHYGSDRFMSKKQFETFYWPTWKRAILATIELGFFPRMWLEGRSNDRLEFCLELPRGKFLARFEEVDMARAKEVLGNHCCISGGVPSTLLACGSPQEVEEHCRDLIKVCGKGGGFILGCHGGIDEARPANVKAMIDSAKKYGRY